MLYVYGFTAEDVKNFIAYSGNYDEFSDRQLTEMEGALNAVLFELKNNYKK